MAGTPKRTIRDMESAGELVLTQGLVEAYIAALTEQGKSAGTLKTYRGDMDRLWRLLPSDKSMRLGTLGEIKTRMLEDGASCRSVNRFSSCVNSFLSWCGRPELRDTPHIRPAPEDDVQPELTRQEYLRLLSAARQLEKERIYLIIKVFALTGMNTDDLALLTVESVWNGAIRTERKTIRIPENLRRELLDYVRREGPAEGPVFYTKHGKPLERSYVTMEIKRLSAAARVLPDKATVRCLQRLYQTTINGIRETYEPMIERSYELMLEKEQQMTGWA